MILIDSSCWLEFFYGTENGLIVKKNEDFRKRNFILPTIIVTEVYKNLLSIKDDFTATLYIAQMTVGKIVDLNYELSILAANLGRKHGLPLADSIIYATAKKFDAELFTMDCHFEGLDNVKFFKK